ncbi:hypothetical protein KP509_14G052600 [Ceratopteris richardii]|uniref:Uncharacterized protein n=1 Tax=Ceratopteris richardii TaxID=49495 RepID=A0A8T2T7V0_CERRI|nr:hypothetical protein KP509_14G052600 [Ceratopteris richardii]KAH7415567.1 hypothetical protein KP509_14G052600 [Ceratopteris richardii]KAH7415568.1 hypothetical protein KP509_14G052600 [Ceratopteris richardii]
MDPLSVLREYTMRGELESIRQVGDEFHFGDECRFPCNMDTAYRSKQGSLYTLDSLVFFVKNTHMKHTDYMQQARALKLQTVTFIDRKALLDYLEGRVQNTDAIELLAPTAVASVALPPHLHHLDAPSEDDVEEYRPDDPSFIPSKRGRLDDGIVDLGGSIAGISEYEPMEMDASHMISFIKERERPIRDRNTILLCHNKDFHEILTMLTKRDEEKRKAEDLKEAENRHQSNGRYGSVDDKRFWKGDTEPKDTFGLKGKPDLSRSSHAHHPISQSLPISSTPRSGALGDTGQKGAKIEGIPIILVPNAAQTLLNMYNAKEFLQDGVYVMPDVKNKKPEVLYFYRKMGREKPVKYEVRDKTTALSPKDWDRVLAAFVLGKEWQFKDWPFKDHAETFNRIMGIYLRFEDDSIDQAKTVKQWNVKIISLSKHKRHQDRTAVLQFWDALELFVHGRRLNIVF